MGQVSSIAVAITQTRMDNNKPSEGHRMNSGDSAIQKFTDMMISRMKAIKASDWKQGWTNGKGCFLGMPQNIAGRNYSERTRFSYRWTLQ